MLDVLFFIILGVLTTAISVLGGHVSSNNPKHRYAFYSMGAVSVLIILAMGVRNYRAQMESVHSQQKLNDALDSLDNSTKEIARVQGLNTKLQEQLLASSDTIASLAKQNISEVTGGDSFCYVDIRELALSGGLLQVALLGKGKNPVSDVNIRIVDLDVMDEAFKSGALENLRKAEITLSFPHPARYSGFSKPLYRFKPEPNQVSKRYNVFINARNGTFTELVRLRRIDGQWSTAIRVSASYYDKRSGLVLEDIDRTFPMETLGSDTDWKEFNKLKRIPVRD